MLCINKRLYGTDRSHRGNRTCGSNRHSQSGGGAVRVLDSGTGRD